jgi:23S rRNA pseudouridine1911/1915/1917 synthase
VSRLDASVSGVLVLARTSKAAARLSDQFRERSAKKVYWAVLEEPPNPPIGELTDWLKKDEKTQRMAVVSRHTIGAQRAVLAYRTLSRRAKGCLVEIELHTGRKHQIRVPFAHLGCPILGDHSTAAAVSCPRESRLHARSLAITTRSAKKCCGLTPLPTALATLIDSD